MAKLEPSILVVDDDEAARSLLRELLEQAGYEVMEAADGLVALGLIGKKPIDLVITDRAMPGMGGVELLKNLRDQAPNLPVLMLSAYGEESFWGQAIGLGAVDYILKPYKSAEVLRVVEKALSGEKKQ